MGKIIYCSIYKTKFYEHEVYKGSETPRKCFE